MSETKIAILFGKVIQESAAVFVGKSFINPKIEK